MIWNDINTIAHQTMKREMFGTDGIRGIANQHPITCETALALGRAIAYQARSGLQKHRIIVGKDTRVSSYMLEMALAAGVCSMGIDVLMVGVLPSPAIAFLTRDMRADAGVIISASHNSFEHNGLKIFDRHGFKLSDQSEVELERIIHDSRIGQIRPTKDQVGKAYRIDDPKGRYILHLKRAFPEGLNLNGVKIVIDCGHGASYHVAPMLFQELGANVICLGNQPDGRNINSNCGAVAPDNLAATVKESQADMGIGLDGDADRIVLIDSDGKKIDGDMILAILAEYLHQSAALAKGTLVTTMMSNCAMDTYFKKLNIALQRTSVGDRYVVEAMREHGLNLGGESCGHIIHFDYGTTGDGIVAALEVLAIMQKRQKPLNMLCPDYEAYPQALMNVHVSRQPPLETLHSVQKLITYIQSQMNGAGRVLVRYSGTESQVRILVEGTDLDQVQNWTEQLGEELRISIHHKQ